MEERIVREAYRRLTKSLIDKNMTISAMESCTSGQIASLITDTEGASAIFPGGFVTYCNEAKIMQGVSAELIEKYTVYSEEVAQAMAKAAQKLFDTDIAIGVTGTMGNVDPVNRENSIPGQVYFAICLKENIHSFCVEIPNQSSRLMYKLAVAKEVYDKLEELLEVF